MIMRKVLVAIKSFWLVSLVLAVVSTSRSSADEPEKGQAADSKKLPEAAMPADVKAGETAVLKSPKGMHYFLRVPASYDAEQGARVLVFMHGSNMNGLAYLRSFESAGWGADDILVCPNGERGKDVYGRNNFTFGSATYVADVTQQVVDAFTATRIYVGGHSQGGFVTYSTIMHYPDQYDGAFPMAGDCWLQNEPYLWENKPEKMARQKKIAIAVIHGQQDRVVRFSQGQHAYDVFLTMGYPKLRFFAPERLGHQFLLSLVPAALAWLDAMTGLNPADSLKLAQKWSEEGQWGWAHQAALAALNLQDLSDESRQAAVSIVEGVEPPAATAAERIAADMQSKDATAWIPDWLGFRHQFGATQAVMDLVESYEQKRSKERVQSLTLFRRARGHFRKKERDQAYTALEQLLENAPHTYYAYYARKWLAARK